MRHHIPPTPKPTDEELADYAPVRVGQGDYTKTWPNPYTRSIEIISWIVAGLVLLGLALVIGGVA